MADRFNAREATDRPAQQVAELRRDVAEVDAEVKRADLVRLLERLAVLDDRVAELKRAKEESERWSRQLVALAVGAVLALLGGVVVQLVAVGLRKP